MSLRIIEPFAVTETNILATNVDLEPEWTAGSYSLGEQRRVGDRIWEVSAQTTNEQPGPGATQWFDTGPANRYAAFDLQFGADQYRVIETRTERAGSIAFTLAGLARINAIAMFGLEASEIRIVASVDAPGDIMDATYELADGASYQGSMWRWMFLPQRFGTNYTNFNLNIPRGAQIEITISNPVGTAGISTLALGVSDAFGIVERGTSRSLRSRAVKRTEGTLTSLLRRTPANRVAYGVYLQDFAANEFWDTVNRLDGVAAVFAGPDPNPEFTVYGFVTSCQTVSEVFGRSKVQLEVETL